MKRVEIIDEAVKFTAFGKTKPKTQRKIATNKRVNIEDMLEAQSKKVEEEILKVEMSDKSKEGRIYRMKKEITGESCKRPEPVAIRNPADNVLVVAPDDIKKVTLQYCKDNLKKKEKAECFAVDEKVKKRST